MIVSITFRHGTESSSLRRRVGVDCMLLAKISPKITRVQVVFYKETHRNNSSDLVTCHMAVDAANKQHINIYEHKLNQKVAFNRALKSVRNKLSRMKSLKLICANEWQAV